MGRTIRGWVSALALAGVVAGGWTTGVQAEPADAPLTLASAGPLESDWVETQTSVNTPQTYSGSNMAPLTLNEPAPMFVAQSHKGHEAGDAPISSDPTHKISAPPVVDAAPDHGGLAITVKNDWVSKYMFRGFDILDDRGAYQPSVDIDLWGTGFHFNWWASLASSSRSEEGAVYDSYKPEDLDEFDYTLYYTTSCLDDCISMEFGAVYYDIVGYSNDDLDFYEVYTKLTLSELPLSPHAYFYYDFPVHESVGGEGWMTCLGGTHSFELPDCCVLGFKPLSIDLYADVWYNGGAFVNGVGTGWSHAIFGGGIPMELPCNFTFTPGVYYQVSMEDSVNPEDEWWTSLSLAWSW